MSENPLGGKVRRGDFWQRTGLCFPAGMFGAIVRSPGHVRGGGAGIGTGAAGNNQGMIKTRHGIAEVKESIAALMRRQVDVTVNLGRNKTLRFCGELSGVYPALFTVRPNDGNFLGKTAYSYAEVLCGSVRVRPAGGFDAKGDVPTQSAPELPS